MEMSYVDECDGYPRGFTPAGFGDWGYPGASPTIGQYRIFPIPEACNR